jgi:predicted transcriptional regulator
VSDVADKWGEEVAKRGFAQIPNYLLLLNQFLDEKERLPPVELLVLMQLVGSWWKKEAPPYPSMSTLASRCGVSTRQIQRAINSLSDRGFISRSSRRGMRGVKATNAYSLVPLVEVLNVVAKAFPNAFPRSVPVQTRQAITALLETKRLQSDASSSADEAILVEEVGGGEPSGLT